MYFNAAEFRRLRIVRSVHLALMAIGALVLILKLSVPQVPSWVVFAIFIVSIIAFTRFVWQEIEYLLLNQTRKLIQAFYAVVEADYPEASGFGPFRKEFPMLDESLTLVFEEHTSGSHTYRLRVIEGERVGRRYEIFPNRITTWDPTNPPRNYTVRFIAGAIRLMRSQREFSELNIGFYDLQEKVRF